MHCHCLTWTQQERSTCLRCAFFFISYYPVQHTFLYTTIGLHWSTYHTYKSDLKIDIYVPKLVFLPQHFHHISSKTSVTVLGCKMTTPEWVSLPPQLMSIHLADLHIVASHPHLIKDPLLLFLQSSTHDRIGIPCAVRFLAHRQHPKMLNTSKSKKAFPTHLACEKLFKWPFRDNRSILI